MKNITNNLNDFINYNRVALDESLVSLKFMKEVDDFLQHSKISQKEFAKALGYSEAFISQLMSGTKKINVGFINKFEKSFGIAVKFTLESISHKKIATRIQSKPIQLNIDPAEMHSTYSAHSFVINDEQKLRQYIELY